MSDKFRTTFTVPVSFALGEQPTSTKLNAISTQARNGLTVLERAIGDMWNQSGDSVTAAYPNRLANLARALGDQALLNSKLPLPDFTGTTSVCIRQSITPFLGKSHIALDFKPVNDATLTAGVQLLKNASNAFYTGSSTVTSDLVDTDTEWFVDTVKGKIHLGMSLHAVQTTSYIQYNVLAADFPSDSVNSSGFSMIPQATQLDWKGLKISSIAANKYFLTLPFRRPETVPTGLGKVPSVTNNEAVIGSPSIIRYFGPATAGYAFTSGVSNVRFYRYSLPEIALGMFTAPTAGATIPSGTLYLWDTVTNTIIEGVTFRIPEAPISLFAAQVPWVIQVEGATLDQVFSGFTSSAATEAVADYQSRFALICIGSSVAEAVGQLRRELVEGDASLGFRRRPSHRDLVETQPAVSARHLTNFPPSFIDGDDHSHLLSRLGSKDSATVTAHRDRFNNGILGDLLLLSSNSSSNYQNLSAPSNYIYLGSHSILSPRINSIPGGMAAAPAGASQNALVIGNSSLDITQGIARFGSGYLSFYNGTDLALFDSSGNDLAQLHVGRIIYNGNNQTLATFTGTTAATRYIDINAYSTNLIGFKGGDLDISALSGTNYVRIGQSNLNTSLRLDSNQLYWGSGVTLDFIQFDDTNNTWSFIQNPGGLNSSIVAVGTLRTSSGGIEFGGDEVTAPTDTLTFDDPTNTFTFTAAGSSASSRIVAGTASASVRLDSPNAPRAWALIKITPASVVTVEAGFNIDTGNTDVYVVGQEILRVYWTHDFSSTSYAMFVSSNIPAGGYNLAVDPFSTDYGIIRSYNSAGVFQDIQPLATDIYLHVVAYGEQT